MWLSRERAFQATGMESIKDLSGKADYMDRDAGPGSLCDMFKGQQGDSVTGREQTTGDSER